MSESGDIRAVVREKYGEIAEGKRSGCGCTGAPAGHPPEAGRGSCCGDVLLTLGYTEEQKAAVPEGADLGLGCGNPLAHAALKPGETVLDLGSGAGVDCFLAAREIGPAGRVIGVDMTPSMIEKARANAARAGTANVEFRLGEIEHLPVADATVDCIISNCVVNLSPDKLQVFRDAHRALKPGGRMLLSDLVLTRPLPPESRQNVALYVGCIAGAAMKDDYLEMIRRAGFTEVAVVEERGYTVGLDALPTGCPEREAFASVVSVKVRARRAP